MTADAIDHHEPIPLPIPRGGRPFDRVADYEYRAVHGALVVTPRPGIPPLTADDVPDLPPGYRDEIIGGRLIVTPGPAFDHQSIVTRLIVAFELQAPDGWRAAPDLNVKIDVSDGDFWRPDVCVIRPGEKTGLWHTFRQFGLLVEIASPSTQWLDDDDKLKLYAEQEVPAYWRIQPDPDHGAPTVHALMNPSGGRYRDLVSVGPGERASVDVPFPFVIEPDRLVP